MPTSATGTLPAATARGRARGLTLIELLVVLAVLALVTTLVAPSFMGLLGSSRLKSAARGLHSQARYARDLAVRHGTYVRLLVDDRAGVSELRLLQTTRSGEEPDWQPVEDNLGRPRPLPEGVAFRRLATSSETGEPQVTFAPDGRADEFFVTLEDSREQRLVVHVAATTGTVEILAADDPEVFEKYDALTEVGP